MTGSIELLVDDPEDEGERADVVLGRRVPELSRRAARQMALAGQLTIDGVPGRPSRRVSLGERLVLTWTTVPEETTDIDVLEVTDEYLFVSKPAGIHTHRLRPDQPPTLADAVGQLHPECAAASTDPREGGVVHRLDHDTTGVVAFARHRDAWVSAREAFAASGVRKEYEAICHCSVSWPPPDPEDVLPGWLARDAEALIVRAPVGRGGSRSRASVTLRGQPAHTMVRRAAVSSDGRHGHFHLELITGRRHQARLHLAWLGLPIVGDRLYGSEAERPMLLHASALDLGPLAPRVEAPWSLAFRAALERLGIPAA